MSTKGKQEEEKSPTNDFIEKCKKELCDEKVAAASESEACKKEEEALDQDRQYKICCLVNSQEANTFYQNFKFCIGQPGSKTTEKSVDKIKDLIEKEKNLNSQYKDLTKMIKEARDKMKAAVECACGLERCFDEEERCNPDILKALEDGIDGFRNRILECKSETENCYEKLNKAFDSAIDISGILTFSDVDSLESPGNNLKEKIAELTKDYDEAIKTTSENVTKNIDSLTECLDLLFEKHVNCCFTAAKKDALRAVYDFICDPECMDKEPARIQEICQKFIEDLPDEDQQNECDDEPLRKEMRDDQVRENRKM